MPPTPLPRHLTEDHAGIARATLEAAQDDARDGRQLGRPLAEFRGLQVRLSLMAKAVAAAGALPHQAAMRLAAGDPAAPARSIATCFAGDAAVAETADAVQLLGGSGDSHGFAAERRCRDADITQVDEGTDRIQRGIIARDRRRSGA